MRHKDTGNLAVKDHDFVTAFTRLTPLGEEAPREDRPTVVAERLKSRFEADRWILEQAREKKLQDEADLDFSLDDLKTFQFGIRAVEDAGAHKSIHYIFQSPVVKIIVEINRRGEIIVEAFQKGRCRRVSATAQASVNAFLIEKALLLQSPSPEPESGSKAPGGLDSPVSYYENEIAGDASPAALMTQTTSDVQAWDSIAALREDLKFDSVGEKLAPDDTAATTIVTQDEMGAAAYVDDVALPDTKLSPEPEFEIPEKNEREIGLKITSLVAKLTSAYSVEDIREGLKHLAAYESKIPGILAGAAVPVFEDACLASYKRILTNKHGFIDDLDEALLKMAIEGGLDPDRAKQEMADRALELFINGLSSQSGKPLKKSRAEKIRAFADTCGKGTLMKSQRCFQAKTIVNDVFVHETQKTPKPQRDREMCKLYTELNLWFGNELS